MTADRTLLVKRELDCMPPQQNRLRIVAMLYRMVERRDGCDGNGDE